MLLLMTGDLMHFPVNFVIKDVKQISRIFFEKQVDSYFPVYGISTNSKKVSGKTCQTQISERRMEIMLMCAEDSLLLPVLYVVLYNLLGLTSLL